MRKTLVVFIAMSFLLFFSTNGMAQSGWAEANANITISEFLAMHFSSEMKREESDALNSFNLVSFYSSVDPNSAFVLIVQTWNDSRLPDRDLRREVRIIGDVYYRQFSALVHHPTVKKRWKLDSIGNNFVIKHVRYSDLNEVLAVTIDDITSFDEEAIKRAELIVKMRGGVWDF